MVDVGLVALGPVLHLLFLGHGAWGDGQFRASYVIQLIEQGTISDFRFSYVGPLFSAPLYLLDKALGTNLWLFLRFNVFVLAAGTLGLFATLRRHVERRTLLTALLLLWSGSMFPFHLMTFYGETFSAVTIAWGLALVMTDRPLRGWALCALGAANTPALLLPLALVSVVQAFSERRLRHLAVLPATAALIMLEAWVRRGHPLSLGYDHTGYGPPGTMPYTGAGDWGYPFVLGVAGLLFSFGRGLGFFTPGLWLVFASRPSGVARALTNRWLLFTAGVVIIYASWWSWHGANFWGPRFLLIASVPASALLAMGLRGGELPLARNLLNLLLLAATSYACLDGVAFHPFKVLERHPACAVAEGALCLFAPEFSPLWHLFVQWTPPTSGEWVYLGYVAVCAVWLAVPAAQAAARQAAPSVRAFFRRHLPPTAWKV